MADKAHVAILSQGIEEWNKWRAGHRYVVPDFSGADLRGLDLRGTGFRRTDTVLVGLGESVFSEVGASGETLSEETLSEVKLYGATLIRADLSGAVFQGANLSGANLSGAILRGTILSEALLSEADLSGTDLAGANLDLAKGNRANLSRANLRQAHMHKAQLPGAGLFRVRLNQANIVEADLRHADLSEANLRHTNFTNSLLSKVNLRAVIASGSVFSGVDLNGADLSFAVFIGADLSNADISGSRVHGMSAWGLTLNEQTKQQNLVITAPDEPEITVDNIELAQFVYLLSHSERLRDVIDTIGKKAVLILGRFTEERKKVLDAVRDELRRHDYLPILFDFDKPASKDLTGTVLTLAHLAQFIIADLTDPSCSPYEVLKVADAFVPIQPILLSGKSEFAMFADVQRRHHWVLATHRYDTQEQLIANLGEWVIRPAEAKVLELRGPQPG